MSTSPQRGGADASFLQKKIGTAIVLASRRSEVDVVSVPRFFVFARRGVVDAEAFTLYLVVVCGRRVV